MNSSSPSSSHASMSLDRVHLIIKAAIVYYMIQFLALQYQTVKIHRTSPSPSLQQRMMNDTVLYKDKVEFVYEKRQYLVASQIEAMEKLIADDEELRGITNKKNSILEKIRANTDQINNIKSQVLGIMQSPLLSMSISNVTIEGNSWNRQKMTFSDLVPFRREETFVGYTTDELIALREGFLKKMSAIENYNEMDIELFSKAPSSGENEFDCERYLTRGVSLSVEEQFVTKGTLESIITDLQSNMDKVKMNPLDDETKMLITQAWTKETHQNYIDITNQVNGLIEQLEDFVATEIDVDHFVDHSGCVTTDDVSAILNVALGAHKEKTSALNAISEMIDDLEESIVEEHVKADEGDVAHEELTLKDLHSLPLYPKVIEKIDSSMEHLTGFNDMFDRMIDSMGGGVEGGVAKTLDSMFNTILKKCNNAMKFFLRQGKYLYGESMEKL
mmetsp:Transcript_1753/g.3176  ORF Transcript_1753/g.3176 Transcript_1753/m.3176 type:complete len:445 (-) Transcript_1753:177-1511(-)|eukprot:CAMPEP_0176488056 /NCGR_PEP_ID=MMETSP0200_2-20121128/6491_1 /TAXON_ID=947934 /ORGANISM="Chaetoceros sp., Strain GSL56" /LENGTH=444 /DNA_ID=CAMNT_0017884985 /DNA_START=95 /DNA_END=1429 /DNA_ORIENTATION=+